MRVKLKRLTVLNNYYMFLVLVFVGVGLTINIPWSVTAYGIVEPVKRCLIKPDVEGVISEVLVEEGVEVKEGQIIARIRDPNIKVTRAANEAEFEKAKMQLEYIRKMFKKGYMSENDLKKAQLDYDLEQTKFNQSKSFDVTAPVAGTLLTTDEFNLRVGDKIDPGSIIATVANLDEMRIKVRVSEHNISKVEIGNEVRVYMNALPSMLFKTISGKVLSIQPQAQVDSTGSYFIVIISLEQNSLKYGSREIKLIPGMAGHAKITYERSSFFSHVIKQSFSTFSKQA